MRRFVVFAMSAVHSNACVFRAVAERPQVIWSRAGHSGMVMSVAQSPDTLRLVSSGYDGTVKIWNSATGEMIYSIRAFGPIALAPDDGRIAIQTGAGVQLRRLSDGALLATAAGSNFARPAWSPDGQRIVAAHAGNTLRVSNALSGQTVHTLTGHSALVRCGAFSPDGAWIVSGAGLQGMDNTVRIWSAATGQQLHVLSGHGEYVGCVAVSPDSTIVASGSGDHTIKMWRSSTGALLRTLAGSTTAVWDLSFSPDGQKIAAASIGGPLRIWNVSDGVEDPAIALPNGARSVCYAADGQSLLIGTQMGVIEQRSSLGGGLLGNIGTQYQDLAGMMISGDGHTLAYGDVQRHVTRVRARDGALIDGQTLTGFLNNNGVVFSPDASTAAILGQDGTSTQLWNLDAQTAGLQLSGHVSVTFASAFSPDGALFATAGEYQSGLWNVATGAFIHWFQNAIPHSHSAVAFSNDGLKIALSDREHAKVFEVPSAVMLHTFDTGLFELSSIAISRDGSTLAAAGTNEIWCWNLATDTVAWNSTTSIGRASGLLFSRDGRHIFLAGRDGYLQIRRAIDGGIVHAFDQETGAGVTGLALSPNGRTFAYARADATIVVARNPVWTVGDTDGDGCVTLSDLTLLLADFGRFDEPGLTDLNDDGATDLIDLTTLLSNFGSCD